MNMGMPDPLLSRIATRLSTPVSGQSLALFRIALGGLLVWDCWRFIKYDRVWRYWVAPEFHFTYPGFGWVMPLPEPWIHIAWLLVGISAFCVMIGFCYRLFIVVLTVGFGYFFLLDKAEYLNHFYLVVLYLVLMCFLPAHRTLSFDAWLFPRGGSGHIPYAAVFAIRAQTEIMLIFAGLVKLTPDWLVGEPLGLWLREQAGEHPFGFLFQYDWIIIAGAWGTIVLHIVGAPLLLWRRTRLPVFLIYCVFHAANSGFFNIGIFPWLTIAATTIFFDPDWPRRFAWWLADRFGQMPPRPSIPRPAAGQPLARIVLLALGLWVVVQVAVPLRSLAFDSDVRWSGEGHRFSWRMRIYDRSAEGTFHVVADDRRWSVKPTDYLTGRQAEKMLVRPDMIHQFAGYLESVWRKAGYTDVAVYAEIEKSLNGRPGQSFVDTAVDLASAELSPFAAAPWVVPLSEPVWGVADNRASEMALGRAVGNQ